MAKSGIADRLRAVDWGDVLRDAHCYGGIALAGVGTGIVAAALTGLMLAGVGAGAIVSGIALFWLSVRRVQASPSASTMERKVARGGPTPNP